jgi:D-proline reductase (dithiol) PrdB
MATAAEPKPLELSRYCVPFTPFQGKLEETSICLVSTAGVRHRDDTPFNTEGDATWRVIGTDVAAKDLRYDDTHYDHACVDRDLNCVFPIDRLHELAREGRVRGLTERHFSLGFSQALRELREKTIPALVREVDRERPGAVLLTGG